jgi:hypothetical protein
MSRVVGKDKINQKVKPKMASFSSQTGDGTELTEVSLGGKTVSLRFGFQPVSYAKLRTSNIKKGRRLVESRHVINVEEKILRTEDTYSVISGLVLRQASVSEPPYKVTLKASFACYCYVHGMSRRAKFLVLNCQKSKSAPCYQYLNQNLMQAVQ